MRVPADLSGRVGYAAGTIVGSVTGHLDNLTLVPEGRIAREVTKSGVNAVEDGVKLFRRGDMDTARNLNTQAQAAEKLLKEKIHGVSVSTSPAAKPGQIVRCASKCDVEAAGFKVVRTGNDPNHYAVELPKPVTKEDAQKFNDLFK